jgi:hypothetical protein
VSFRGWQGEAAPVLLADPLRTPTGTKELEQLPLSWKALLQRRGREATTGWQLHDQSTAYQLVFEDGEYLMLAEREGDEFILCRMDAPDEGFFHLRHHDGIPERLVIEPEAVIWRGA